MNFVGYILFLRGSPVQPVLANQDNDNAVRSDFQRWSWSDHGYWCRQCVFCSYPTDWTSKLFGWSRVCLQNDPFLFAPSDQSKIDRINPVEVHTQWIRLIQAAFGGEVQIISNSNRPFTNLDTSVTAVRASSWWETIQHAKALKQAWLSIGFWLESPLARLKDTQMNINCCWTISASLTNNCGMSRNGTSNNLDLSQASTRNIIQMKDLLLCFALV